MSEILAPEEGDFFDKTQFRRRRQSAESQGAVEMRRILRRRHPRPAPRARFSCRGRSARSRPVYPAPYRAEFCPWLFACAFFAAPAFAPDKVVFASNWLAQAEHGGSYHAVADGTYANTGST